jgi:dihydroorotase
VIDPAQNIDEIKDILIEDCQIASLEKPFSIPSEDRLVLEANGKWVLPGLVDLHVHLRTPGHVYKEDLSSGLRCAAAGGFTSVLAMANTSPTIDTAEQVAGLLRAAKAVGGARLYQSAAMTIDRRGQELCEYEDLKLAGAVAVTDDGSWVVDSSVMRRVLGYAQVCSLLPLSHCQDPYLSKNGQIREDRVSARLGLAGVPYQAEEIAVFRDISLCSLTKAPVHLCHLSAAASVDLVRKAKSQGLKVSCETAPHYLFLTDSDLRDYDSNFKMNPPLGTQTDLEALRQGLCDGTVDVIATDHAPQSILEKEVEFNEAAFGVIGLETALSLTFELSSLLSLSPKRLVELTSLNPARLLNLPAGDLKIGRPADLIVFDPEATYIYDPNKGLSKSRNSPFAFRKLKGRVLKTLVGGQIVHDLELNPLDSYQ